MRGVKAGICKIWISCDSDWIEIPIRTKANYRAEYRKSPNGFFYDKKLTAEVVWINDEMTQFLEDSFNCCSAKLKVKTINGEIWLINNDDYPLSSVFTASVDANFNGFNLSISLQSPDFKY